MVSLEKFSTQISGKYSPDNMGLFDLRQRLVDLGADVHFPAGPTILEYPQGFAVTAARERTTPFYETERAFLRSIGMSDVHIVYNKWGNEDGYLGESSAVEAIEATAHGVPTVWLRAPGRLSSYMSRPLRVLAERAQRSACIEPLDELSTPELLEALGRLAARETGGFCGHEPSIRPAYDNGVYHWENATHDSSPLTDHEAEVFLDIQIDLDQQYRDAWERYQSTA